MAIRIDDKTSRVRSEDDRRKQRQKTRQQKQADDCGVCTRQRKKK
jgi:hypothetical protein